MSHELIERIAQITAHRACCGTEHDPLNGKLHGDCVVCGVPFPCEYIGKPRLIFLPLESDVLTVRDSFAIAALAHFHPEHSTEIAALNAYRTADAMLKARKAKVT